MRPSGFCARYCDERFGKQWHLSPEQSFFCTAGERWIPDQLVCAQSEATNNGYQPSVRHNALRSESCGDAGGRASHGEDGLRLFSRQQRWYACGIIFSAVPVETQV